MKVVIDFASYASIIEFTPFLGEDIENYKIEFEKWYYDGKIRGRRPRPRFINKVFDTQVIIDWINEVAPEANPKILIEEMNPNEVDPSLPGLYF